LRGDAMMTTMDEKLERLRGYLEADPGTPA
jgi:hypothetical protein